ncbi:alpha/beta fold hydrolase [Agarilytica rhodophyticola]|uniref:alpha/beta fold hydrolase n=1 Tax=Agarilytica rhodophyticola TaxID=1737490 RepID=UPI0013150AF4|nr:alpha/beta hydrolase [Agarilytica rhodophyticola]
MLFAIKQGVRVFMLLVLTVTLTACFAPDAIVKSGDVADGLIAKELVSSHLIANQATRIHYVMRKNDSKNLIVFIHGTPGSWTVFSPQLSDEKLVENANLVAIDRPGWGGSTIFNDDGNLSLARQSQLIGPVLSELRHMFDSDNLVLVGHSLGGSLVPRIAMDYPELVDAVVVLAGDLTDQYPAAHWYNNLATWLLVKWMLPSEMVKANDEVLALQDSLTEMKPLWRKLRAPLLIVQGNKDELVDPRHADFAEKVGSPGGVRVERFADGGHLVHLTHAQKVSQLIAQMLLRKETSMSLLDEPLLDE